MLRVAAAVIYLRVAQAAAGAGHDVTVQARAAELWLAPATRRCLDGTCR